jgi:hypothetical protein
MSRKGKIAMRILRRLGGEDDGFTVVFALVLLVLGIAVGAAALADTLASRSHTNLDQRQRRALQAADFGVEEVIYRANQLNLDSLDLSGGATGLPVCVVHQSNGEWTTEKPKNGVCPKIEEELGNHDSYQAEFIPNEKVPSGGTGVNFIEPKIVSLGIDNNGNASDSQQKVYARVEANLGTIEPFRTIEANHDLYFKVPLAEVFNGTARAAHKVYFSGEKSVLVRHVFTATNLTLSGKFLAPSTIDYGCGPPEIEQSPLIGPNVEILLSKEAVLHEVKESESCSAYFKRVPIKVEESKPNCGNTKGEKVSCAGLTGYFEKGDYIKIEDGSTLTLEPGKEYVFCSLWTNGPISIAAGASNASLPVRVFIDNPAASRCSKFTSYKNEEANKLKKETLENVEAGSFYASQGVGAYVGGILQTLSPTQVQIYLAGSGEADKTKFTSGPASLSQAFLLYAPQSNVNMSATTFSGALIGYDVTASATTYTQNLGLNNYPQSNSYGVFHEAGYTQCSPAFTEAFAKTEGLTGVASTDVANC